MKEEIFKHNVESYYNEMGNDHTPISKLDEAEKRWNNDKDMGFRRRLTFSVKGTDKTKESFVENYGNPLWTVERHYSMVVVERDGDKVALKLFTGGSVRKMGLPYFKKNKFMWFVTVNTKTGDVYAGEMRNYQKKRKCTKVVRRNYFANEPLENLKAIIKNNFNSFETEKTQSLNTAITAVSAFIDAIDQNKNNNLTFSQRLLKFHLDKKGIKYPNNFYTYISTLSGKLKKKMKKTGNKLVESIMKEYNLSGKVIKKALHNCEGLNIQLYQNMKQLFGEEWINQKEGLTLSILNFKHNIAIPRVITEHATREELRRMFSIFKTAIDLDIDTYTLNDHLRFYSELKLYGEETLKWMSCDSSQLREEHLDWVNKLEFYRKGFYERQYPQQVVDQITKEIEVNGVKYFPVLLKDSGEYNGESNTQNNCVKGYIGRASSIIVSLRKDSPDSNERATIEFILTKQDDNRVIKRGQTLGKFNQGLPEEWNDALFILDEQVLSCYDDESLPTVRLTKELQNGQKLESDSEFGDYGGLTWTFKGIEYGRNFIFDLGMF